MTPPSPSNRRRAPASVTARALALAALGPVLGACALGPDFQRPAPPQVGTYGAPAAGPPVEARRAQAAWWRLFRAPVLDDLIARAVADNPDLATAEAKLAQAVHLRAAVAGADLPQVDASAGLTRTHINLTAYGFTGANPTLDLYSFGPGVSYVFDLYGGQRRAVEGASAEAEAQGHRVDAAYLALCGGVVDNVARIAGLDAEIAVTEALVADDERTLALVEVTRREGTGTGLDVLTAQAKLAADRARLPPLRLRHASARHALSVLVGQAPGAWTPPRIGLGDLALPDPVPVSLPSQLVRERPDILAAEAEWHAATARVGVATADLYPRLTLSASFAQTALTPSSIFDTAANGWSLGAGLAGPIFDGGTREARRQQAIAETRAAAARYQGVVLEAFAQVADALAALGTDIDQIKAETEARDIAARTLDLTRASYRAGTIGIIQVLDAQGRLDNARLGLVRAQTAQVADLVRLFAATGTGWRAEAAGP